MTVLSTIWKIAMKLVAAVLWVALGLLSLVLVPISYLYMFLASGIATLLCLIVGGFLLCKGFDPKLLIILLIAGVVMGLRYLLPWILAYLDVFRIAMMDYIRKPLSIKSPVTYS